MRNGRNASVGIEALVFSEVHQGRTDARENGESRTLEDLIRIRREANDTLMDRWEVKIESSQSGVRTLVALLLLLSRWRARLHETLEYRLVLVLLGRGCFGSYRGILTSLT